jgi:aspartate-semialdehyde dehydrogenase
MSRPATDPERPARVAVVGAFSVEGAHLREALAEHGVPGSRVDLYGMTGGEVVLSEYAGEARVIQEPDLDEVARHEMVFLCTPWEIAAALASAAPGSAIIDLQGCLPPEANPRRVPLEIDAGLERGGGRFVVPHSLALVVAEVLRPLDRRFSVDEAMAVVIRPAADFGREGVEELREQTVRLLNFSEVPVDTFGRQLAFNVVPEAQLAVGRRDLEGRIAADVTELLGWSERRFTVRLLTASVFHGHGFQLRFRLARAGKVEAVRAALEEQGLLEGADGGAAPTPLDVTGETRTCLSDPVEDGLGAYWVWGAAGEAGPRGARQAVRLAAALFDL